MVSWVEYNQKIKRGHSYNIIGRRATNQSRAAQLFAPGLHHGRRRMDCFRLLFYPYALLDRLV